MQRTSHQRYSFDEFTVDLARACLLHEGQEVKLRPKSFEAFKYLIENRGRLVTKEELIQALWPDSFVTDDSLVKCLRDVRLALGDESHRYVKTVPRRGYIFEVDVVEHGPPAARQIIYTEEVEGVRVAIEEESDVEAELNSSDVLTVLRTASTGSLAGGVRWHKLALALLVVSVLTLGLFAVYRQMTRPAETSAAAPIRSIAVLPLKNLTNDATNEYFSDGMTESLISALSKIEGLKVISRGSVFRFKGKESDPKEVGRQLEVAAVLEGSVRRHGDSVRVAVRLVSVEDGRVLWANDTNDRALGDIFALQDEIARNVVAGLRVNLSGERAQQLVRRYTGNIEAYQLYLKGRYFWNKRTEEGLLKSIEYFEHAIDTDPDYALAYVGLADSYLVLKSFSLVTPQEAHAKVETALKRALEIDDTLGQAHTSLAWLRFSYDWNWSEAEREFRRAIELQPNDATTHQWYAEFLSAMGRFDESLAEIRRAQQIEPPSLIINVITAHVYLFGRQYDQVIEQSRKTLELDPNFHLAHVYLGYAYHQKEMYVEALAEFKKAQQIEDTEARLCEIGIAYAASGNREEARKVLREVMESTKLKRAPQHSYRVAVIYTAMGERDAAFAWLEKAFIEREETLVWLKVDPQLDPLRSDPRFADLLRRVGFTS